MTPKFAVSRLSMITIAGLLVLLGISRYRYDSDIAGILSATDSSRQRFTNVLAVRDSALQPGDALPDVQVTNWLGEHMSLVDLPRMGYSSFYFYRTDCPACQFLEPFMAGIPGDLGDSVAFVAISRYGSEPVETRQHHFAVIVVQGDTLEPVVGGVPTVVRAWPNGRVVASALGVRNVAKLMGMYGLVDPMKVYAAIDLASSGSSPTELLNGQ